MIPRRMIHSGNTTPFWQSREVSPEIETPQNSGPLAPFKRHLEREAALFSYEDFYRDIKNTNDKRREKNFRTPSPPVQVVPTVQSVYAHYASHQRNGTVNGNPSLAST